MTLAEDIKNVQDALNNAHGPLCQWGECSACEAHQALLRIIANDEVHDHPPEEPCWAGCPAQR